MTQGRCFFISSYSEEGSFSDEMKALGSELVKRGHRVIFLINGKDKKEKECPDGNPAFLAWPSVRPTKLADAWFLLKLIRRWKPQCFISNFEATNLMLVLGRAMGIPLRVAWYRTLSLQAEMDTDLPKMKVGFLRLRKRFVFSLATHILSVSEAAKKDIGFTYKIPSKKVLVLSNAMYDPAHRHSFEIEARDPAKIVCVGRFYPSKGQKVLIRAIHLLKETMPGIKAYFIGDGPQRVHCEKLAGELNVTAHCVFMGSLSFENALTHVATASVAVVPSVSEAFGRTIIEALSVGTPLIASNIGGIPEIITDGMEGFLVPPNDPKELACSTSKLLKDPLLHSEMSRNARRSFLEKFEQTKVAKQKADWLEMLVAERI